MDLFSDMRVSQIETVGTKTYILKLSKDGRWGMVRMDKTVPSEIITQYATILSNPTFLDYSTVWSSRASLVYNALPKA